MCQPLGAATLGHWLLPCAGTGCLPCYCCPVLARRAPKKGGGVVGRRSGGIPRPPKAEGWGGFHLYEGGEVVVRRVDPPALLVHDLLGLHVVGALKTSDGGDRRRLMAH